jgi:predicted nucleotidyltransferase
MSTIEIIEKLKAVKPYLQEKYTVNELALFGSYSRNEQTAKSDIDILVSHSHPLGFRFLDMVYELDKLFDTDVQVVSKGGVKPKYLEAIKADLIYV